MSGLREHPRFETPLLGTLLLGALLVGAAGCGDSDPTAERTGDASAAEPTLDAQGRELVPGLGLVKAPGYELVATRCVRCHGPRQFLQQRGDRETWLGMIRWMQREHGLESFPPEVEDGILDYLSTHYAPGRASRRAPLPAELLPPNPYAPATGGAPSQRR
jgi:hypothetical protein